MLKYKNSPFVVLLILNFLLICAIVMEHIDGRADDDTELSNTSFKDKIESLYGDDKTCQINVGDKMVKATAIVMEPFKMPTCLKEFYTNAHQAQCGKSMYNKFSYCAKAMHFGNKNYSDVNTNELLKAKYFLVLINGCLTCSPWPERSTKITIHLIYGNKYGVKKYEYVQTRTDIYGDFKIGSRFHLNTLGQKQFQPHLEIEHTCNQRFHFGYDRWMEVPLVEHNVLQKQILKLPVLRFNDYKYMMYELKLSSISLLQGEEMVYTGPLNLNEPMKKTNSTT